MTNSLQDTYYLRKEGDAFFDRAHAKRKKGELREAKYEIIEMIDKATKGKRIATVLEYGCNYGDLLNFYATERNAEVFGVEVSNKAIEYGKSKFVDSVNFYQGSIADNPLNKNERFSGYFDLVIIEDVFGWVSRETLLQSIANIDNVLKDGGLIFIRDFYMNQYVKNRNHHIDDAEIYCYKLADGYANLFTSTGMYEIISKKIWMDGELELSGDFKTKREFEDRWSDTLLKKSVNGYYLSN